MATIFGNSLATGQYAKGSNEPLAEEVTEIEDDVVETVEAGATPSPNAAGTPSPNPTGTPSPNAAATPSPNAPSAPKAKRAKTSVQESEDRMMATFSAVGEKIASAIVEAGKTNDELPEGLWDSMRFQPNMSISLLCTFGGECSHCTGFSLAGLR
jgi:hypothetical protein